MLEYNNFENNQQFRKLHLLEKLPTSWYSPSGVKNRKINRICKLIVNSFNLIEDWTKDSLIFFPTK